MMGLEELVTPESFVFVRILVLRYNAIWVILLWIYTIIFHKMRNTLYLYTLYVGDILIFCINSVFRP